MCVCVRFFRHTIGHIDKNPYILYSGRIIPYSLFVFEAIRAIPNKVFSFGHTPNDYITYLNCTCNR